MLIAQYVMNVLIAIDQLGNALIGGDPDETLSSRFGKAKRRGEWWARPICRFLSLFDKRHCMKSIHPDEGEQQLWKF